MRYSLHSSQDGIPCILAGVQIGINYAGVVQLYANAFAGPEDYAIFSEIQKGEGAACAWALTWSCGTAWEAVRVYVRHHTRAHGSACESHKSADTCATIGKLC